MNFSDVEEFVAKWSLRYDVSAPLLEPSHGGICFHAVHLRLQALKMELKNLRGLVEKQEQRRVSHGDMPTPQEAVEVFQVRTS